MEDDMVTACCGYSPSFAVYSYSNNPGDRQGRKVTVFNKDIFGSMLSDESHSPDPLLAVRDWINGLLKEIPVEYHATAVLDIDSVGGYEGEHHAEATVYYIRPETDEEWAERVKLIHAENTERDAADRKEYERLRAKYAP